MDSAKAAAALDTPSGTALMAGRRQAVFCSQERLVRSLSMEVPMM